MAIDYDTLRKRFPDISPMVLALPLEGLEEYPDYMDIYTERETYYIEIIQILRRLKAADSANDYEDWINENFKNTFLNPMEREIEERRILSKWLNP